jgi:Fur family transcriptional regulator, ferric uptake regulator
MTEPASPAQATPAVGTVEDVLALFRARGGRVTSSRRLLVHALFDGPRDRTAEELAAETQATAPDINLSTIYRNLDELERLGVIVHAHLAHGPATYHLASQAHGHLVCEECGATIEAPDDVFSGLSRTAQSRYGFQIHPYHFAVSGRCQQCRSNFHRADAAAQPHMESPTTPG